MKTLAVADEFGSMSMWGFSGPQSQDPDAPSSAQDGLEGGKGETCIANISPRERLKRLIGGVIPFVIALGALA